jgi:hypothetical protein
MGDRYSDNWLNYSSGPDSYLISIQFPDDGPTGTIVLGRNDRGQTEYIASKGISNIIGWKNFIVTREPSGQFYVYLDGELLLGVLDNRHTDSEKFSFLAHTNPAIDNITISDTIDYDRAPPQWIQAPQDQNLFLGENFTYHLNATDYAGIDQWWIDDVENFTITDEGVITNIGALTTGIYTLNVFVNDTYGNTLSGTFLVTVTPSGITITIEMMVLMIGVPAIVVVIVLVWRYRKR